MAWPIAVARMAAPFVMNAVGKKLGGQQEQQQQQQPQMMAAGAGFVPGAGEQGAQQVLAGIGQGPQGPGGGYNARFTGIFSDLAAAAAGGVAGMKASKDIEGMNAFEGFVRGAGTGFFQKNAFDNVQKDGGAFKVATNAFAAGLIGNDFDQNGPSGFNAALKNMGAMSGANLMHDTLTDRGYDGAADLAAGSIAGMSTMDLVTDKDWKQVVGIGGGLGAAVGAGYGALNGTFANNGPALGAPQPAQLQQNAMAASMSGASYEGQLASGSVAGGVAAEQERQMAAAQAGSQQEQYQA